MKTILALATALFIGTAFAQETKHMIEFNADSVLLAKYAFNKSKTRSESADNDSQSTMSAGYALSMPSMPQLQLGGRVLYNKSTVTNDEENYGAKIGVIWNHNPDLSNALYASLYIGMQWNHTYGTGGSADENRLTTLALGKRFDLKYWGINHLTYTPEIALVNQNSTTKSNIEYRQSVELRLVQFSVFF